MRVNISFSVELEEVPKRVLGFLEESGDQLQDTAEHLGDITSMMARKDYLSSIEEIAKLRDLMATIDYKLDDCMQILSGYSKALADMPRKDREPPQPVATAEQVAKFENDLKKLREETNDNSTKKDG